MSLEKYKEKRDFTKTSEPQSGKNDSNKLIFVIQRHKATNLHYDLRLEVNRVLKSWAVPKGPSMNPKDKRLAMMVEDHPYDYKDFAGVIPEGYGAGIVEIWDKGTFEPIDEKSKKISQKKFNEGFKAGSLKFILKGKKIKGEFALIHLKNSESENAWLLIKHRDKYAVDTEYDSEKETSKNSPINKWLVENKKTGVKKKFNRNENTLKKLGNYLKPMLAKEVKQPFDSKEWMFEIKWDGYRAIAEIEKSEIKLYSRNGNSFIEKYSSIVNGLKKINIKAVLDGEIVVLDKNGVSNFQLLQHYEENKDAPIFYYVFDLLYLNGEDLSNIPLFERKILMKKLIGKNPVVKYSSEITKNGIDFFNASTEKNLEGIMAKRIDSLYIQGKRTSDWLKIKNHNTADVFIAGYTEPTGSRKYFGSLVIALKEKNVLTHVGHVGTGFSDQMLKIIFDMLQPFKVHSSPFNEKIETNNEITWLKPILVCEIKYAEKTTDGKFRHPVFIKMREDMEVKLNEPKITDKIKSVAKNKIEVKTKKATTNAKVKLTNLDKIYWPDEKITKGMLIEYYQSISNYILPYLKDRPQSLKRNPNGISDDGFYHKDAGEDAPNWVKSFSVHSESSNKEIDYIICNDKDTLAYLNNLGCIELNPWHSTTKKPNNPDYLIIDIDPSDKNTFNQVIDVAICFKKLLAKAGAACYCKTSGASGLHIFIPMGKKYTYDQIKDFAHILCLLVQEELSDFTTLERNLKKRGKKKIYLDHLQNRKGQTIASVYSVRPKNGATVSMPLLWDEVKHGLLPTDFTIFNSLARIEKTENIFKGILGKGVDLKTCLEKISQ